MFGIPVIETKESVERLPETQLAYELKGTFANSQQSMASALISESGEDAKRYFLGEFITDEIELVRIEKELVVLRRNNRDEALRLSRFGEISIGPELGYRKADEAANIDLPISTDTVDITNTDEPESTEVLNVTPGSDKPASSPFETRTATPRLSAQERLTQLRARYSSQGQ